MRRRLASKIEDVRIRRTDLTAEVSQQTFDRMKAERLAEAERLRARGREAAQRIRARADREVVEIVAEARKESEILRGQGEGERNAIFADAFQRDPEFFEFYRSMAAYMHGAGIAGTTMVLSPDSEFFRYFKDSGGTAAVQARRYAACASRGRHRPPRTTAGRRWPISWRRWALSSSSRAWSMAAFLALQNAWRPRCFRTPENALRIGGLVAIAIGVGVVWLARG